MEMVLLIEPAVVVDTVVHKLQEVHEALGVVEVIMALRERLVTGGRTGGCALVDGNGAFAGC